MENSYDNIPPVSPEADRALKLTQEILANPEAAMEYKRLLKKVNPKYDFPEVDIEEKLSKSTKEMEEKMQAELAKRDEAETNRQISERRKETLNKIKSKGFNDEETAKIEAIMAENGIVNPDIAISYYREANKPVKPTSYRPTFRQVSKELDFKDPHAALDLAHRLADDFINARA